MLNEISCLFVDWNAIGTWVGGIGSIAAAAVAVWLASAQSRRRRKFARFLLLKDLARLRELIQPLQRAAEAMADFAVGSGDERELELLRDVGDSGLTALRAIPGKLEFFGRSEQLFEYGVTTQDFEDLNSTVNLLLGLNDVIQWAFKYEDEMAASDEILKVVEKLECEINKFERYPAKKLPS